MARRRHSNRKRRRGSFGFLYKVLSMLVICGCLVAALTLFFRVNTIVVTGQQRYTQDQIVEASGVGVGDNLFLLNKYAVAGSIRTALPYVDEIRINRKLPDTLLIEIKECGPPMAEVQDSATRWTPSGWMICRSWSWSTQDAFPWSCPTGPITSASCGRWYRWWISWKPTRPAPSR